MLKLKFNVILRKTMQAVRRYLNKACNYNIWNYCDDAFRKLACHMDVIDVGLFVPIIIMNASTHQALLSSQGLVQLRMPLSIAMAPLMLDAQAASRQMQFLSYVSQRSVSLEEKVGPRLNIIPPTAPAPGTVISLESDSNPDKGRDPHKTTPVPKPMDTTGEPAPSSSMTEPIVPPRPKPKDPSKEESKVKEEPKVKSKDPPPANPKPENGLAGEPSRPPVAPTLPAGPPAWPPSTPTTADIIMQRIKEKKPGSIPVPPIPAFPGPSKPSMPVANGKDDTSNSPPAKRKMSDSKTKGNYSTNGDHHDFL